MMDHKCDKNCKTFKTVCEGYWYDQVKRIAELEAKWERYKKADPKASEAQRSVEIEEAYRVSQERIAELEAEALRVKQERGE
jgi:hypothetical protein